MDVRRRLAGLTKEERAQALAELIELDKKDNEGDCS